MYKIVNAECLADKIHLMDRGSTACSKSHCQPGQFIIVKMDEKGERIPLTICDYDREEGYWLPSYSRIVGASTMQVWQN